MPTTLLKNLKVKAIKVKAWSSNFFTELDNINILEAENNIIIIPNNKLEARDNVIVILDNDNNKDIMSIVSKVTPEEQDK